MGIINRGFINRCLLYYMKRKIVTGVVDFTVEKPRHINQFGND